MDEVLRALGRLYEVYFSTSCSDPIRWREEVERALAELMIAYNAYLG